MPIANFRGESHLYQEVNLAEAGNYHVKCHFRLAWDGYSEDSTTELRIVMGVDEVLLYDKELTPTSWDSGEQDIDQIVALNAGTTRFSVDIYPDGNMDWLGGYFHFWMDNVSLKKVG